jgi:cytochrome P450
MDSYSDENRLQSISTLCQMRSTAPVFKVPPPFDAWMIFDYDSVQRALNAPDNWFIFKDPPKHTKLRALISRGFGLQMIANLEPVVRELSRSILDQVIDRGRWIWPRTSPCCR